MQDSGDAQQVNYPWLKTELFTRIIQKVYPENVIQVQKYAVKAALAKGENFSSQMLRVTVTYTADECASCEIRFILKVAVSDLKIRAILDEMHLFQKEIVNFEYILPEVYKLLESLGDNTKLSAACYETNAEHSYIIFEDLTARGFLNREKRIGFTVEHYELVVKKLAKWHAANAILKAKEFEHLKTFKYHPMHTNDVWEKMTVNILRDFADVTKLMPGFSALSAKMYKSVDTIYAKILQSMEPDEQNYFVTLCHGDLWSNNIMFTSDQETRPIDAIFCDYQVSFVGPAVSDLANSLYTSGHMSLRGHDYDRLVEIYHAELSSTLSKLKYTKSIPTLDDIQAQLFRGGVSYAVMALFVVAARSYEKLEDMDMGKLSGNSDEDREFRYNVIYNVKDSEGLKFLLNYFDQRGYFD